MAYVGITNQPANVATPFADLYFALKEAMKLAGWTVLGSGTGTAGTGSGTYNPNGDCVTTVALFNNPGAWVRLREPGVGTREYIFHRGTVTYAYNGSVHYSRATGYTLGNPSAGVIPHTGVSGDGIICHSGNSVLEGSAQTAPQASPVFAIGPISAAGYTQAVASTAPVNGVYGFWAWQYTAGTGALTALVCSEGLAVGSTNSEDQDPSYRMVGYVPAGYSIYRQDAPEVLSYWEAYSLSGKAVYRRGYLTTNCCAGPGGQSLLFPIISGLDPYTSKASFYPSMISAGAWPKGYTTGLMWGTTTQNSMDVFNISSDEPRIHLGPVHGMSVPWVKNIIPLV